MNAVFLHINIPKYLFYLFNIQTPYSATAKWVRVNIKERRRKDKEEEQRKGKRPRHPTPARIIDALVGDEQNGREKQEKNKEQNPNPATLDPSVASYNPQGSHGQPILLTCTGARGSNQKIYFIL